jgi:outer membrane protein OmpA-like peptidoglycan-associated protein
MFAAAAALLCACTIEQKSNFHFPERDRTTWKDRRLTREEILADKELMAIQERIGSGDLPKIQFEFDSDVIQPRSYATLDAVADWFLRHPDRKVRISAHTCTIGAAEYNLELSERRAKAVKTYLVQQGVPPPAIRYKGYGFSQPLVDNSTEENREKNRRVEFRLVTRDWDSVY